MITNSFLVSRKFSGSDESSINMRLGQILLQQAFINQSQLDFALDHQKKTSQLMGQVLIEKDWITQDQLLAALSLQAGIPIMTLESLLADGRGDRANWQDEVLSLATVEELRQFKCLPFLIADEKLHVVLADPCEPHALQWLRTVTSRAIECYYCEEEALLNVIEQIHGSGVSRMIADMGGDDLSGAMDEAVLFDYEGDLEALASEPTVVNLVNLIILEAVKVGASDIHVEPFDKRIFIKYRIDGVLHEQEAPGRKIHSAIVSRIKILANLNIAERFVPQDGHIHIDHLGKKVDVRVSTLPTIHGESVVMRLLDRSRGLIDLEDLGLSQKQFGHFSDMLSKPHGIVLVTGPTGSGKTTTLYAALNHIFSPQRKILTIEDPPEYNLDGINQIPVNEKRGVDFATGLRAILRHDPDVVMIGEIRDQKTADIAIRAALTGHLVLSTLHTNDAPSSVTRLIDMGVEPFLVSSSVIGVLAQRLVRKICSNCGTPHQPDEETLTRISRYLGTQGYASFLQSAKQHEILKGKGCHQCRQTGYAGRMSVMEIMSMSREIRDVIMAGGSSDEIAQAATRVDAKSESMRYERMLVDGLEKVLLGATTLEEVLRITATSIEGMAEETISLEVGDA